jgi:hypothetical protein
MFQITVWAQTAVVILRVVKNDEEGSMRKGIVLAFVLALLVGCGSKGSNAPAEPKWKGAPYRLAFDDAKPSAPVKAGKRDLSVITIPTVKYVANPEALETRAMVVLRFTATGPGNEAIDHHIIGLPLDIRGETGVLPADYMERASTGLADYLGAHCIQGKVSISIALARSSLNPQADQPEVDAKRLSDWLPLEVVYKKAHGKC